jgi:hypothetical protein
MQLELLGVGIAIEGGAATQLAEALRPLAAPRAPPRGPELLLVAELTPAPGPVPDPAVFVHFPLRAARRGGALLVGDGSCLFVIAPGGRRIDAHLRPDALADGGRALAALHLPVVLAFALRHHGVFHLHAAGLADGERAILVAGQSGVGKTTLALAILDAGFAWLCDDAAFVTERDAIPRVEGVPRPFHLHPETLGAFAHAAAVAGPADASGRRDLDPERVWPGRMRRGPHRPGILLFPEVTHRPATTVERLTAADSLGRLVEASALLVVDGAARSSEHLALLGRLASEAPALRVGLGEDLLRAPAKVALRILAAAGG